MWNLHDRLEGFITEETCKAEIESFAKHGQLIPALGRPLKREAGFDVELIYGARRLFIARHLNKELRVRLCELTDREAIIAMDIENRMRRDISPYERGLSFAEWLRAAHFNSQDEIARALKISASQVSRLVKIARLPSVIVDAFDSPASIAEGWGLAVAEALEDSSRRHCVLNAARMMTKISPRLPPREVYMRLLSATAQGRKTPKRSHDEVVVGVNGKPCFRIRHQTDTVAMILPLRHISSDSLSQIREAVLSIMQGENADVPDPSNKSLRNRTVVAGIGARRS